MHASRGIFGNFFQKIAKKQKIQAVREALAGAAGKEEGDGAGRCEEDRRSQHKRILYNLFVLSYYIYALLI